MGIFDNIDTSQNQTERRWSTKPENKNLRQLPEEAVGQVLGIAGGGVDGRFVFGFEIDSDAYAPAFANQLASPQFNVLAGFPGMVFPLAVLAWEEALYKAEEPVAYVDEKVFHMVLLSSVLLLSLILDSVVNRRGESRRLRDPADEAAGISYVFLPCVPPETYDLTLGRGWSSLWTFRDFPSLEPI